MTTECGNCKKSFPIERTFDCKFCDEDESESCEIPKKTQMFCNQCSDECFVCELRGCEECVQIVCGDCSVPMCEECGTSDALCGCYGKCHWCNKDVNRGSHGWPCWKCERWGCNDCRHGNGCKECDPIAKQASNKQLDPNYESIEEVTILKNKIIELELEIKKLKDDNARLLNIRNEPKKEIIEYFGL